MDDSPGAGRVFWDEGVDWSFGEGVDDEEEKDVEEKLVEDMVFVGRRRVVVNLGMGRSRSRENRSMVWGCFVGSCAFGGDGFDEDFGGRWK